MEQDNISYIRIGKLEARKKGHSLWHINIVLHLVFIFLLYLLTIKKKTMKAKDRL